jgi:hypothetical protein
LVHSVVTHDILNAIVNNTAAHFCNNLVDELAVIRDGFLKLSINVHFSNNEIEAIVNPLYTVVAGSPQQKVTCK